jgi:FMN phosphatase YigB (HAD superfamily)
MEDRHHLTFDTYEEGKLTLEEYLGRVVFYQKRPFTRAQFRHFIFAQSKPYLQMIELVRKPDADIFRLALDIAQVPARQVVYIENTPMFVQVAEGLGIRSILHTDCRSTCAKLASLGLQPDERVIHETK